jgi:hypothetical protein
MGWRSMGVLPGNASDPVFPDLLIGDHEYENPRSSA